MPIDHLTDALIRKLPATPAIVPGGGRLGLYLRVRSTGRKTWITRRRIGGKWRVETLGHWPKLTAQNARRMADGATTRIAALVTFGDAADAFFRESIEPRYRTSAYEVKAYLDRDCATLRTRRLDRIKQSDVVAIVRAKATTSPNAAGKLLAVLKQLMVWARLGELLDVDPLVGLTRTALKIPKTKPRERKLSDDELRDLWAMPEPYGPLLRFALLTGGRIGEALQFAPAQVVDGVWHIAMTKNGRAHAVPLSTSAAALAREGWPSRGYQSLHKFFSRSSITWRPHDLRRTAATKMYEAGAPTDAIEAVLNHTPPALVRAYTQPDMLPAMRDALTRLDAAVAKVIAQGPVQEAA